MSVAMGGGYGPSTGRVDIGGWLGQAWTLFSVRSGIWVGTFLVYFLLALLLWVLWSIPTGVFEALRQSYLAIIHHAPPAVKPQDPFVEFGRNRAFSLVLAAVNAIFFGGLYKMALRQARGEPISLPGLFSGFPQALPLMLVAVAASVVIGLLEGLCLWLLHRVGMPSALAISLSSLLILLPTYIVQGLLMFAPLLIVDQKAGAVEAILGSVRLLKAQWLMAVLAYFVLSLIGGIGAIACLLGMFVTYPLFLISVTVGYVSFTQPPLPAYNASPDNAPQAGVWPPPPYSQPPSHQPPSF